MADTMICPNCGKTLLWTAHKAGEWYMTMATTCERCRTNIQMNYSENPAVRKLGWKRQTVPALRADDV